MEIKKEATVRIKVSELLSLVAYKLKDRVLFPEKVEETKRFIDSVIFSVL